MIRFGWESMKKALILKVLVSALFLQSPAVAQTYSSFFEDDSSSFSTLEDSFSPSRAVPSGDSVNSFRDARDSYIDALKTINRLNVESKFVGLESMVIGEKRSYVLRDGAPAFFDNSVRTTGMGCFVTQIGATGC